VAAAASSPCTRRCCSLLRGGERSIWWGQAADDSVESFEGNPGVALYLNRDWKESGGLDRNSAFMVRWRVRPIRRKHALEHHSGVHRRIW
jgi:hypothetical protein